MEYVIHSIAFCSHVLLANALHQKTEGIGGAVSQLPLDSDPDWEGILTSFEDSASSYEFDDSPSEWANAKTIGGGDSEGGDVAAGLPSLVIIGAQKGGTTFLRSALHTHKRLGTCCHPQNQRETIECGFLQWIPKTMSKEKFARKYSESMASKSCGGDVLYDDRPDYLVALSDSDIQLAASILPKQTLFVVTMRDPVPRMQSAMAMDSCMHGTGSNGCKLDTHLAVLDTLPEDASPVAYGLYAKHLKRWLAFVPKERLQMLFFEDITKDPLTAMNKVVGKMGLEKFTDLGEVRTKPPQQEHCRLKQCGAPVKKALEDRFKEAAQCARFQKLYGPANAELAALSGSNIPLGWTKC